MNKLITRNKEIKKIIDNVIKNVDKYKFLIVNILYILSIITYELFFCNGKLLETGQYNFSISRIFCYVIFEIILLKFGKNIIKDTQTISDSKLRKIILILYIAISIILIPTFIYLRNTCYVEMIAICFITMFLFGIFIICVSDDYVKNTIVVCFTFGLIFCTTTRFNYNYDEVKHFMTAFNISFGNFDYKENYICDSELLKLEEKEKFKTYVDYFSGNYEPNITEEIELTVTNSPAEYSLILYLPSALGILVSRICTGSFLDMYLMGRLFNLLAYTFLVVIALKILPYKKNIFYIIFNLPLSLILAASYSTDGISIGVIGIFIAYCLKLYDQKEKINIKQLALLMLSALSLLIVKSLAYVGVGLVIFILPFSKIIKDNKKYLPVFVAMLAIGSIISIYMFSNLKIETDVRGGVNTNAEEQVEYLLETPKEIIPLLSRHLVNTIFNLRWLENLNTDEYFYSFAKNVFMFVFLFIMMIAINDNSKKFKIKEKIIFMTSFFVVFVMTSMALYIGFTEVEGRYISGYQTRYILPILPLLLICLNNNVIDIKIKGNIKQIVPIVCGVFSLINIIGIISV